jgi:Swiss Army Knife protein, DSP-PTPase phosphatase domain
MMTVHRRPISESYWVETGRFLAGEHPAKFDEERTRKRVDAFLEAGFDTFIDLTQPGETFPYESTLLEQAQVYGIKVAYRSFAIGDFGLPTPGQMNDILDAIEESLRAGRRVYLHCWGGIGRTGTTVGCYLVRQGKAPEEALNQLLACWRGVPKSQIHPHSPETQEQVNFIRAWAQHDAKLPYAGK